ncbi:MAG: hypothetical protein WAW46_13340 [Polaromonas sp.]
MKPSVSMPPGTVASRLKQRILHPWSPTGADVATRPVTPVDVGQKRFPASIAEFLLVFRLRVRLRAARSADVLERALRVVLVTCTHWFMPSEPEKPDARKPR